jgi:type IX secretion system PorP/SprF family membrane protein
MKLILHIKSFSKTQLFVVFVFVLSKTAISQDIQFSQFYANPLYLNPAFAGSAQMSRAIFHQRLQWPSLDAKYITSSFSLDHYFDKYNSGLGMIVLQDWQGANTISSTEAGVQYSYDLNLNSQFALKGGVEAKYVSRYINYGYLTMPDQYNNNGFNFEQTREPFGSNKVNYLDLSVGGVLYSERFWLGIASNHVNQPNQSFYRNGKESRLPLKMDFATGYKFYLEKIEPKNDLEVAKEISIIPTAHYKSQGKSDQLDLGIYGLYYRTILGAWYRGIPLLKSYRPELINNESVVLLAGWRVNNWLLSYSYDLTVSKLTRARTGGSHELNITYVWKYRKRKSKPMKRLPCPDYFD